jgi:hypothetical protein
MALWNKHPAQNQSRPPSDGGCGDVSGVFNRGVEHVNGVAPLKFVTLVGRQFTEQPERIPQSIHHGLLADQWKRQWGIAKQLESPEKRTLRGIR